MIALILSLTLAVPVDAPTLRARAALAIAFADAKPPTYEQQLAKAIREGKPLVVWVGQPVRHVGGCVCHGCDSFPDAGKEAVVIGVQVGNRLIRVDLPGRPSESTIREVIEKGGS
jgi:hypothetical protein